MTSVRKPRAQRKKVAEEAGAIELVKVCARVADEKKAENVIVLDLREIMYVTDFFLIATGTNPRQLNAIRTAIHQEMSKRRQRPIGIQGAEQDRWILMDYGDFVIHLFDPEWRRLYDLELLWGDAPRVSWEAPRKRKNSPKSQP